MAINNLSDPWHQNYNQQTMLQAQLGALGQSIPTTEDLRCKIAELQEEVDRRELHTILPGPTNNELNEHESLREAWDAYKVIRKLIGLK